MWFSERRTIKAEVTWQPSFKTFQFSFYSNGPGLTFLEALGSFQIMHLVFPYFKHLIFYCLCQKVGKASIYKVEEHFSYGIYLYFVYYWGIRLLSSLVKLLVLSLKLVRVLAG